MKIFQTMAMLCAYGFGTIVVTIRRFVITHRNSDGQDIFFTDRYHIRYDTIAAVQLAWNGIIIRSFTIRRSIVDGVKFVWQLLRAKRQRDGFPTRRLH